VPYLVSPAGFGLTPLWTRRGRLDRAPGLGCDRSESTCPIEEGAGHIRRARIIDMVEAEEYR